MELDQTSAETVPELPDNLAANPKQPEEPQTQPTKNGEARPSQISADEIALYDRQIRLWGVQAQQRLRQARILIINLKALGNECVKNLVLAGVGSVTILDEETVSEDDLGAQFFLQESDIGKKRAEAALPFVQNLNPRVQLSALTTSITSVLLNPIFFQQFTMTIATDLPIDILQTINSACRIANVPFYAASSLGMYGWIFADLIQHQFVIERAKSNIETKPGQETLTRWIVNSSTKRADSGKGMIELVTKSETYCSILDAQTASLQHSAIATRRKKFAITPLFTCVRALWQFQLQTAKSTPSSSSKEDLALFTTIATNLHNNIFQLPHETLNADFLRSFLQNVDCELAPVAAMLGGVLAQDVINVVGGKEQPIQNLALFDGEEGKGPIYLLHPVAIPVQGNGLVTAVGTNGLMGMMPGNGMPTNGQVPRVI